MFTYTFSLEHFGSIMSHMQGLQIVVETLSLSNFTYTMTCNQQIEQSQYEHMQQNYNIQEVI